MKYIFYNAQNSICRFTLQSSVCSLTLKRCFSSSRHDFQNKNALRLLKKQTENLLTKATHDNFFNEAFSLQPVRRTNQTLELRNSSGIFRFDLASGKCLDPPLSLSLTRTSLSSSSHSLDIFFFFLSLHFNTHLLEMTVRTAEKKSDIFHFKRIFCHPFALLIGVCQAHMHNDFAKHQIKQA